MTENNDKLNMTRHDDLGLLRKLKKSVMIRAALALAMIVLTLILLFSLTLAWYTNIVQTGGLVFETEQWNFDGNVILKNQSFEMSPGDSGVISLTIENSSDHVVSASITVSKQELTGENVTFLVGDDNYVTINPYELMKKRLYFYVDTTTTRNRETVTRVYVSEKSSYTYTIFPHSSLILDESAQRDSLLKWEWVYDVLGYYVWGEAVLDAEQPTVYTDVIPQYYIRPIEYDFDEMTTTFDGEQLATIDGSTTAMEFLQELTSQDGYAGSITPQTQAVNGYYPISVDNNGRGVWLRLCTYSEIQQNMQEDAMLGRLPADQIAYRIRVNVTGQNSREDAQEIRTAEQLLAALNNPTVGIIRLADHITLTESVTLTDGQTAIIDLNGKTLTSSAGNVFDLTSGASLSLRNGSIIGDGTNIAVKSVGGYVTLDQVNIDNVNQGVVVRDYMGGDDTNSTIQIVSSKIHAKEDGVLFYGHENASGQISRLIIKDSEIIGDTYSGIWCSGNYCESVIEVIDSKITGKWAAIYHPQKNSALTITSSTLQGNVGLVVKGGTVNVVDSTISGVGEAKEPAYEGSGFTDTGDGIYLDASYAWTSEIHISGNTTVTSKNAQAVRKFEADATQASITITGGTYSSNVAAYCTTDHVCVQNSNGTYTVLPREDHVIDTATVEELLSALGDPSVGVIRLTNHVELNEPISLAEGQIAVLDLNGKTLTSSADDMFDLASGAILTLRNGSIVGDGTNIAVKSVGGDVSLNQVNISNVNQGVVVRDYLGGDETNSTIQIVSSNILAEEDGVLFYGHENASGEISRLIIKDSKITGDTYSGIWCNGNYCETDIEITNSTITGYYMGIYHPQKDSTMTIDSSTVQGLTGLGVKGGTVCVKDSVIIGIAEPEQCDEPAYEGSGVSVTGDAIYLEATYEWPSRIEISGNCQITSKSAMAVRQYKENEPQASITITGGTYNTNVKTYCAEGYECVSDEHGNYTVQKTAITEES